MLVSRRGDMDIWRFDAGVTTWRYGDLEIRCWCCDIEVWTSVDSMLVSRRGGMSSGGLEARCRRTNMELWRRAVGVVTWRRRPKVLEGCAIGGGGCAEGDFRSSLSFVDLPDCPCERRRVLVAGRPRQPQRS